MLGAAIALFVFLFKGPQGQQSASNSALATTPGQRPSATQSGDGEAVSSGRGELVIYLGDAAQESLSLQLDGVEHPLTSDATQRIPLKSGNYAMRLRRRGYLPVEQQVTVTANDSASITPSWEKADFQLSSAQSTGSNSTTAAPFDHNVDVAQRRAQAAGSNLLILFVGSDWSRDSQQLLGSTLAAPAVHSALKNGFQLAVLDYPLTRSLGSHVEDPAHNQWMAEKYHVDPEEFPTLVAADASGTPYTVVKAQSAVAAFVAQIQSMSVLRQEYERTLAAAKSLQGAKRAIEWLKDHNVLGYHGDEIRGWYDLARAEDPDNTQGTLGPFFEASWQANVVKGIQSEDARGLRQLLTTLNSWHDGGRFQDADRGARMHLLGVLVAVQIDDIQGARSIAERGATYETTDAEVARQLKELPSALANAGQLGSGSGFVVAPGYILTNYHVIEGPGKIKLGKSDGSEATIDARVVATDRDKDLALLLSAEPIGAPLAVATESPGRGAQVAAFGFPLGDAVGSSLKLTTGVISGLPNARTEQMLLLDMRINPGNSGGPLCNPRGEVVGVVTARTLADAEVDAYGMAISRRHSLRVSAGKRPRICSRCRAGYSRRVGPRRRERQSLDHSRHPHQGISPQQRARTWRRVVQRSSCNGRAASSYKLAR